MANQREKTVSYRRAEWFQDAAGLTLEKCIRDANKTLTTIEQRTINRGGQHTCIAKAQDTRPGLFVHITADTPGEFASVVPKVKANASEMDLKVAKPPPDGEWLDGDAFLYVNDDHVCLCSTSLREGAVTYFLKEFFKKASLRRDSIGFELMKAADISKIRLIRSQGVRELEIRGTLYKATAEYEKRKTQVTGTLGLIGKHLKAAILKKPHDVTPDGVRVSLTLKADRRFGKSIGVGYKNIEALAADVINNTEADDDYVIITKTGQRISQKEIFMRSKVPIESKAWRECSHFFNVLKEAGVVEQ
jgi:hypothetical protein